jgi:TRAP-type mannitol/chloroaromatic compound transport system permease small subunit
MRPLGEPRPRGWLRLAAGIDRLNGWVGRAVSWLVVLMVLVGAANALLRYIGRWAGMNLSSNAYIELQWYLFSLVFLLGGAYALREDAHVRVDVFYARVSGRVRSWINLLGTALLLMPFCVFTLWVSIPSVRNSWRIREVSPDPGGLPRYPLKAVVLVAFALLILQGIAEFIKESNRLRRGTGSPADGAHHAEGV